MASYAPRPRTPAAGRSDFCVTFPGIPGITAERRTSQAR